MWLSVFLITTACPAYAIDTYVVNIAITRIRTVGDYQGTTFDNTFEIWFDGPVTYATGSKCTSTYRFIVDAKNKHIYASALTALLTGRKVSVNVDDTLPIRDGACEVSFLDIAP